MTYSRYSGFMLAFTIIVSTFGSFTILLFALYPPVDQQSFAWRKPFVGLIFALICISGIIAALVPGKCSRISLFLRMGRHAYVANKDPDLREGHVNLRGHHPDCGRFSTHVIITEKHVYCAACVGLASGALAALAGTAQYFFLEWDIELAGLSAVLFGLIGITLGLVQFKMKSYTRAALNAFFVFAAFLVLAGIDKVAMNLFVDLYTIAVICFWVTTRIKISQWDHQQICHSCTASCELKERKKGC